MTVHHLRIRRRSFLAAAAMVAAVAAAGPALADAKVIRISTPGSENEVQSKGLVVFKEALEKAMPGAFDVQIHYNGTLFAQGTEIEAMQRGNLEVGMTSPAGHRRADPGILDLHHRLPDARRRASRRRL